MLRSCLKWELYLKKIFKVRILIQEDFQPIVTSELCIFIERQSKPVHTIVLLPSLLYIVYTSSCWHQLRFSRLWPARILSKYQVCHVTCHLKISSVKFWCCPITELDSEFGDLIGRSAKVCTILVWYYIEGANQENESGFVYKRQIARLDWNYKECYQTKRLKLK